jgi:pilus assembly protein CpaB
MKRVLAAAVIFLVAAAAAGGVLLFMNGVRERAEAGRVTVDVIVAAEDIPAAQELNPLIDDGVFRTKTIDIGDLVPGAITDVYQLRGQRTAYPIVADEQIVAARLAGPLQADGGVLGIPGGLQAASIALEPQRVIAGAVKQGDHVQVFGTFTPTQGAGAQTTRVVIEDALVLGVAKPEASGGVGATPGANITVTLAVSPEQASVLIFAQEQGHVWLTLLPPNQRGVDVPPVSLRALR